MTAPTPVGPNVGRRLHHGVMVVVEVTRCLLDMLLGERCPVGCGQRVFPKDLDRHRYVDHAGEGTF